MNSNKVTCNLCGRGLDDFDVLQDLNIHKTIGYGSTFDGEEIHLKMCCECLDELIEKCSISPII